MSRKRQIDRMDFEGAAPRNLDATALANLGKEDGFVAAYADGVERLEVAIEAGVNGEADLEATFSGGLAAALDFLAAEPALARMLLVEALAGAGPARLRHERSLLRLAKALRQTTSRVAGDASLPAETARLLAGGLASHLSGRVLAGETTRLSQSHEALLAYLCATTPSTPLLAEARSAVGG